MNKSGGARSGPLQRRATCRHSIHRRRTHEHRVIGGAPGSGKTQILLHRARHLLDTEGVDISRLRIFIYTNVLGDYIRSALNLLNLSDASVSTFDSWCREYYQQHVTGKLPW